MKIARRVLASGILHRNRTKGYWMHGWAKVTGALLAAAILTGCGSQSVAAPVTSTQTAVKTTTAVTTATATETSTATVTATEPPVFYTETEKTTIPAGTTTRVVTTTKVQLTTATKVVTREPPPPAGSVRNGNYLVGSEVKAGNYKCSAGDASDVYWETDDSTGGIVDNGFGLIAFVNDGSYSVQFKRCDGIWSVIA